MKAKIVLILLFSIALGATSSGQKSNKRITITGYVVDANQYPVSDAVVMIDGIKTKSLTDHNGFYKVKTTASAKTIGIAANLSGSGTKPLVIEEPVNGLTRINFAFDTYIPLQIFNKSNDADEEEIDIGYGTQKKKDLTVPVSKVDGTNKRYSGYSSIYNMLLDVPGVQVNGNEIQIQGVNSFNSSTEPLYVVDGLYVNSIDNISPQWVKSIEVLKGPAASIYGSRGSNGVILINLNTYPD